MKDHMSTVSVLLLLFYMGWFMWDQNKLIQKQNEEINRLKQQILIQSMFIQTPNNKSYNNLYN